MRMHRSVCLKVEESPSGDYLMHYAQDLFLADAVDNGDCDRLLSRLRRIAVEPPERIPDWPVVDA